MNTSGAFTELMREKEQEIFYSIEDYLDDLEYNDPLAQYLDILM